jgi:hypothetical protein
MDESFNESVLRPDYSSGPGSPSRKSDKENTPTGSKPGKEGVLTPNHAALSRQEQYQSRETSDASGRNRYNPTRGMTAEELEKLHLPKVKRLANVTQICKVV